MTSSTARTVANVALASAGVAVAVAVMTNPALRRLAVRATRMWLGASVPAYVVDQVKSAWVESGQAA
jgi:hypothetical protein